MSTRITADHIAHVLEAAAPEDRLALLRPLLIGAPSSLLWPVMLEWLPRCDDIWPHHRWLRPMLFRAGAAYPYMSSPDKRAFDALTAEQWVLRGAQSAHKSGLSWTTNPDTAAYFARLHSTRGAQGHIYDAMIAKQDIFAVLSSEHGQTVLLNNTKLYEINRVEQERTLADRRPSFEPDGHYYDDNDDRKTAELLLWNDPSARAAMGAPALSERVAKLPPIENMAPHNLAAALAQTNDALKIAHDRTTVDRLEKQRDRLMSEAEARARGEKPGRAYVKNGGGGSWGQKKLSPGRPTNASEIVTLPVRGRPLSSANDQSDEQEDEAA